MPLPLLLVAPAAGAALVGLISGADAADKAAKAKRVGETAATRYARSLTAFDKVREDATHKLAAYGALRLAVYDAEFRMLQTALDRIGGADRTRLAYIDLDLAIQVERLGLEDVDFTAVDAAKAGIAAAGAGSVTYFAALGAVGAFGVASTGTPIAALGGAAAANATLAWFGGGAMAAGGLGAGVGAAILGGVVLGPALAIGGFVLNGQANRHLEEAKAYAAKIDKALAELSTARQAARLLGKRAADCTAVASELRTVLAPRARHARAIAYTARGFGDLDADERRMLHVAIEIARTLKGLLDTPLMDEDGKPSSASGDALRQARVLTAEVAR